MHAFAATEKRAQQWWPNGTAAFGSGAYSRRIHEPDLPRRINTVGVRAQIFFWQGLASGPCRQQLCVPDPIREEARDGEQSILQNSLCRQPCTMEEEMGL